MSFIRRIRSLIRTPLRPAPPRRLRLERLEARDVPAQLLGLGHENNTLYRFDSIAPSLVQSVVFISGLQSGELIKGIDFRPRTGQLYALGVVDGASVDTLRLYTVNPLTGAATLINPTPLTVASGTEYGFDFNPTVDRIRVTHDADKNFRFNPNNGARADFPVPDTDLNPAGQQIEAVAYDRNFDTGLAVADRTTLYGISLATSSLVTVGGNNQSPSPNGGQILNVQSLAVTVSTTGSAGFDIATDATGTRVALAVLTHNATGLTNLYSIDLGTGTAAALGTFANGAVRLDGLAIIPHSLTVTGAGAGAAPDVKVFDATTGLLKFNIQAFPPTFTGGVRVAVADVNLDGVQDIIAAAGPTGSPHVRVFSGIDGAQLPGPIGSFFAFAPTFTGGLYVAGGDVNGDGNEDVIISADANGGPNVKVVSGATGTTLLDFFAYDPNFTGGVRVASADFDNDGDNEIVTAPGAGGGPHVRVFDNTSAQFTSPALPAFPNSFFAYDPGFNRGVFVAAGDVNGDGTPDIVTGPGANSGPHVKAFSGVNGSVLASFFAFASSFSGGVRVSVGDADGDGRYEIVAAAGPGTTSQVRYFAGTTQQLVRSFNAFDPGFFGGVFVGGGRV